MTDFPSASDGRLAIRSAEDADLPAIITLWERCELTRPWNDPHADLSRARKRENSDVLIGRNGKSVVATVMVGHDGHRGWVYYVAVDPDRRKQGHGRAIVSAAESWLRERGIEKLQLMVRPDNTQAKAFYEMLNFEEQERIIYAKWLDGRAMTP